MAMMEYDSVRRFQHHNSFDIPNYHYGNRNSQISLSHDKRNSPRKYPVNNHARSRAGAEREDLHGLTMENGPARRRIAVACARCRKRKIRCSGDRGDELGCNNCRQAGIDPNQCLFQRVGSDNVAKVIDSYQMSRGLTGLAVSHSMLPIYSVSGGSMLCPRSMPAYQYPQSDAKPVFSSGWNNPYSEDNSPVETYNLENMYETSHRWNTPTTRSVKYDSSTYCDQDPSYVTHGLPHIQPENRVPPTTEVVSPLNMCSLQANLPEKSHMQRVQVAENTTPQRQLPMPQPTPALTARNVVDQMQDQRLRTAQVGSTNYGTNNTFIKPLLPWAADGDIRSIIVSESASIPVTTHGTTAAPVPSTAESNLVYAPASDTVQSYTSTTDTESQSQLDFSTPISFDSMNMPPSTIAYSNFRDYRGSVSSPTRSQRPGSRSGTCVVKPDSSPTQNQSSRDTTNSYPLVSRHQGTSPSRSHPPDAHTFNIPCRGVHEGNGISFQRSPISTVKSNL